MLVSLSAHIRKSRYLLSKFLIAAILSYFPAKASAEKDVIQIYASESSFSDKYGHSAYYKDLAAIILPHEGIEHELQIAPHMRSAHLFTADPKSCRLPSNLKALSKNFNRPVPETYVESLPFSHNNVHVFSGPGTTPPSHISELIGKKIAIPTGSRYLMQYDLPDTTIVNTDTDSVRTEILMSKRVDFMLGSVPSVRLVFKKLLGPWPEYNPSFIISSYTLHLACHSTPQAKELIELVNARIAAARDNGELDQLHKQHGLIP
ncbi:MAG: transporter substrate-binding domain-containing protein [Kordiimonas sp.]